ncbi:MAG TPA: Ig-like domain-containing protein, partial [Solirubrobacterales bacterium]|nr:Ig-like domain-containing protein [Solirubrobacterales bacterium]
PAYEVAVAVSGNGSYSPTGFAPGPGLYRWTAEYAGDGNNETVGLACGSTNQASAVGTITVTLASGATGGTVGNPVTATATLGNGAIPAGQITFTAFAPADANCSGAPVFSSDAKVSGNGGYRSAAFVPTRVGTYRWTVAYSGDPNHAPAITGCGAAASRITQAQPSISGAAPQRITVGTPFTDTVSLQGGFAPRGTITFRIYGPVSSGCAKPDFVNTVAASGNGTFSSDPFVALRPGRYSFVASYSGDAANQSASEPCDSPTQVVQVGKRAPRVKPRAILVAGKQISIRARLSGSVAPAGTLNFRLYGPNDRRCARKPAFSGGISVKRNGIFSLGRYIATRAGTYRLGVGYSGDKRNQRFKSTCKGAQSIRVK